MLKKIFTWWNGATIGTLLFSKLNGNRVGEDGLGNVYFEGGKGIGGQPRRWVIYAGPNDASRVPPGWHGWLHHSTDLTPDQQPAPRAWQKEWTTNLTGTADAYRPRGALEKGGVRAAATGDYEAWSPN